MNGFVRLCFFLFVLLVSCIEPFDQDLPTTISNSELVVQGFITDYEQVQTIFLTRTQAVNDTTSATSENGAIVNLMDNLGNTYLYQETQNGVYALDSTKFKPNYGYSYKINIELTNGESYSSDFQELLRPNQLDSIWYEVELETIIRDQESFIDEFVNFYASIETNEKVRFFYSGKYQYIAPYQGSTICWVRDAPDPENIPDFLICYLPDQSTNLIDIISGEDVIEDSGNNRKIFRLNNDRRFSIAYSMLVEKFTLTDSYYNYLEEIKQQGEDGTNIFAPPPTEIFGNIISINTNNTARGFFTTISKSDRRIFIDDVLFNSENDPNCELIELFDGSLIPNEKHCCDCRLFPGATDVQPEYWGK